MKTTLMSLFLVFGLGFLIEPLIETEIGPRPSSLTNYERIDSI